MDTAVSPGDDESAADLNPCATCHTNCCRHYTVYVSGHDIVRLSNALNLHPIRFIRIHEVADSESGAIRLGSGWYFLALRRFGDACAFLADDGSLRCTVNAFKPSVCRSYPFRLRDGVISQRQNKLCPSDWPMNAELKTVWRDRLEAQQCEDEFHLETVHAWNEKMAGKSGLRGIPIPKFISKKASFLAFMKFVAARVDAATIANRNRGTP